ncbi:quinone-dependent dihydroorotate dehydrogenase [Thalassospira sp.]|uniref:quinone-dependent dihydroorotate dehydrogenase n=1 Tax=Thalassospira sp. TaxID=1912094 RepID=UPI0027344873|nr:quinone-dependent dihydroorotate dehydrogenase [Thalassospira sp.]MDP2697565.1 quinone-dependent dihydroorotate dehydrogenase [Thalassospira sp.]
MAWYTSLVLPVIRWIDAECAHGLALWALKNNLVPRASDAQDVLPILETEVFGRTFANPVGLAAGFDKNAEVPNQMLAHGFGFVEIGSVTPEPQAGNRKPRLFRLYSDRAVINRMGFNNDGAAVVATRLRKRARRGIVGANLGKNKYAADAADDYAKGVAALGPYADYLVINVSSPNTPGLRALQGREPLQKLLSAVLVARDRFAAGVPVLLKVAPDLTDEDKQDIAAVVMALKLDGMIVSNTTIDRPVGLNSYDQDEAGGLSGPPLMEPSTRVLADFYRLTKGTIPLIGVGGVASGKDAYEKILNGASLVQLYSALVYHGPGLVQEIREDLARRLRKDGFASVADAVGAAFPDIGASSPAIDEAVQARGAVVVPAAPAPAAKAKAAPVKAAAPRKKAVRKPAKKEG